MAKLSPMMTQYFQIKEEHQDCILFFRLGDFYEMFFEDAKLASQELELTLTGRDCGQEERAPMCGVPYHSSEAYIARLIAKGYKVAICEQTQDPKEAKGLVERDVVRIITPGTVLESSMLEDERNNFISSVYMDALGAGLCFADITTGEIDAMEISSGDIEAQIMSELGKFNPSEVLLNSSASERCNLTNFIKDKLHIMMECGREELFDEDSARESIENQFKTSKLKSLGFCDTGRLVRAVGALFSYLHHTQKNDLSHMQSIQFYQKDRYMQLDNTARRNLELTETLRNKEKKGTLLWVLDKTNTSMGSRLLRQWIDRPLLDVLEIEARLTAVEELSNESLIREELKEYLRQILDIERLSSRIAYGIANARDLRSVAQALTVVPYIKSGISNFKGQELCTIFNEIDELSDVRELIDVAIVDEPPFSVREGNIIRDGYHPEVDELRGVLGGGKEYLARIEAEEREKTGIKNLKIGYNRVFGYYIELSKSNVDQAPEHYIRKQTLTNGERFITPELKKMEATILGAQERICTLEQEIFKDICMKISAHSARIHTTAQAISRLDVLNALADVAVKNNYVRPTVNQMDHISIKEGRHPVVERMLRDTPFVPNDTILDCANNRMAIITGPNMAGKSTYMRQVALIVLMAQIGSFVPAESAEIGAVDKIFTRIGASDDLASGQSTFMVEMSEVADILRNATPKSLLILDEIGRGTSTFDGMSIARAVIEYTADEERIGAKTLFATHYHELTALEDILDGVKNYNIAVKKQGFDITFLRKIIRGGADDSYGIEVAKLAGLPESIIHRSKEILLALESIDGTQIHKTEVPPIENVYNEKEREVICKLRSLDINTLTPIQAHQMLYDIICEVKD